MLIATFLEVLKQVLILGAFIAVGFFSGKKKILTEEGEVHINRLMMNVVIPVYVLTIFNVDFDKALIKGFILVIVIMAAASIAMWYAMKLLIRKEDKMKGNVLKFATMFTNYGYFTIPLAQVMLDKEAVFYCCAVVMTFNIMVFSFGLSIMNKEGRFDLRETFRQPVMWGVMVGLALFFLNFRTPFIISEVENRMAALNAPLGLLIVGSRLSRMDLREIFDFRETFVPDLLSLVIFPICLAAALRFIGVERRIALVCVLWLSAPAANFTSAFTIKFGHHQDIAAKIVSEQAILAILTVPIVYTVASAMYGL